MAASLLKFANISRVFQRLSLKQTQCLCHQHLSVRCLSSVRGFQVQRQQNSGVLMTHRATVFIRELRRTRHSLLSNRFYSTVIEINEEEYQTLRSEVKEYLKFKKAPDNIMEQHTKELENIIKLHQSGVPLNTVEINMTPDELMFLAGGIYLAKQKVPGAVFIAAPLFHSAAVGGNIHAKYTYAQMARTGEGVTMDIQESVRLLTELAENDNHPLAQFSLASLYYYGIGVEKDRLKALKLYQLSADSGIISAYTMIGHIYFAGDEEVDEDVEKAVSCYQKAADTGEPGALVALGHCYTHGKGGLEVDHEKAFTCHSQAAEQGHPLGFYNTGVHYFSGKGSTNDFTKAAEFFQKASDLGVPLAQINLGNMYYQGIGVEVDWGKAKALYEAAAPNHWNAKLLLEELNDEMKKAAK